MLPFTKPALSIPDQVALLERRGLAISDRPAAAQTLARVGYYRFSGYALSFESPTGARHQFSSGANFDAVVELYEFDRRLRLVVLGAIERLEVAFRSHMTNAMSAAVGPHWFLDPSVMEDQRQHGILLAKIADEIRKDPSKASQQSVPVKHYYATYSSPSFPPSWVVLEELSIGTVSRVFAGLIRSHRRLIAKQFGVDEIILVSWMRSLSYIRNVCAHHGRFWNRIPTIRPRAANFIKPFLKVVNGTVELDTVYAQAVMIRALLERIGDEEAFVKNLVALASSRPDLQRRMGFPGNWESQTLWI